MFPQIWGRPNGCYWEDDDRPVDSGCSILEPSLWYSLFGCVSGLLDSCWIVVGCWILLDHNKRVEFLPASKNWTLSLELPHWQLQNFDFVACAGVSVHWIVCSAVQPCGIHRIFERASQEATSWLVVQGEGPAGLESPIAWNFTVHYPPSDPRLARLQSSLDCSSGILSRRHQLRQGEDVGRYQQKGVRIDTWRILLRQILSIDDGHLLGMTNDLEISRVQVSGRGGRVQVDQWNNVPNEEEGWQGLTRNGFVWK